MPRRFASTLPALLGGGPGRAPSSAATSDLARDWRPDHREMSRLPGAPRAKSPPGSGALPQADLLVKVDSGRRSGASAKWGLSSHENPTDRNRQPDNPLSPFSFMGGGSQAPTKGDRHLVSIGCRVYRTPSLSLASAIDSPQHGKRSPGQRVTCGPARRAWRAMGGVGSQFP